MSTPVSGWPPPASAATSDHLSHLRPRAAHMRCANPHPLRTCHDSLFARRMCRHRPLLTARNGALNAEHILLALPRGGFVVATTPPGLHPFAGPRTPLAADRY